MRFVHFCLMLAALSVYACRQQAEQRREEESAGSNYAVEKNQPQARAIPPNDAEMQNLLALQDRIVLQPHEIALRRQLGEKAIDLSAGVVWTVGRGRLAVHAASNAVAKNQAALAARIDASRWAAYLLEWHKHDYAANYGSIQARVPPGDVVNTSYTDSTCVVLLKTNLF